jgi:hypothetical protein
VNDSGDRPRKLRRRAGLIAASVAAMLFAASALSGAARAGDALEFWPEFNAFVRLNPQTRLYCVAAYAKGKESPNRTVDLAGYVDVSLRPTLRPVRRQEDWARNRFLWARIGYDHVFAAEGVDRSPKEERGILSLYAKDEFPGQLWLEGRVREDLRWIDGEFSTRYRLRAEATREFMPLRHPVTPYFNIEWFYDNRYDDWSRILCMGGTELTIDEHFRFEVYLAQQKDFHPNESTLRAVGILVKVYY